MKKGVDIGGTFIKVYWEDGRKEKHYIKDISKDKEAFLERIKSIVFEGNPEEVGIAVAGFTSLNGVVYRSPNIPALDGMDLKKVFEGIKVKVINDVSAGALGEWFYDHRDSKVFPLRVKDCHKRFEAPLHQGKQNYPFLCPIL